MIWTIVEYVAIITECLIATRLFLLYFKLKSDDWKYLKSIILFAPLFITDVIGSFGAANEVFFILTCVLSEFIFAVIFLQGSIMEKLMISIVNYALLYCINLPVIALMSALSGVSTEQIVSQHSVERMICIFISKLMYFLVTQLILWLRRKEKYHFSTNEWIIILSAFFITLLLGFSLYMITTGGTNTDYIYIIATILLSTLDIIVFVFMRKLNIASASKTEKKLLQFQLQQQKKQMQQLNEQYNKISIMHHDYKHEISCIRNLIEQKEYDNAISYADTAISKSNKAIRVYVNSSSSVLNAVINDKLSTVQASGINTVCQIDSDIPEHMEYDLSILLSNLLENAIEACQHAEEAASIDLTMSKFMGYYQILIKNTIPESVLASDHGLKTRKRDKINHGWGLRSVKDIADSYDGMMDVYEEQNNFVVNVMLKIK